MYRDLVWAFGLPIAGLMMMRFGFGFNGLYGQDGHIYYQFASDLIEQFPHRPDSLNYSVPPFYPLLGSILGGIIRHVGLAMQLISTLALGGVMYITGLMIRRFGFMERKEVLPYLILTMILSPYMFRGAMVVMTDMLTAFFSISTFWFYVLYREKESRKYWAGIVVMGLMAFFTRYAVAPLLILPCVDALRISLRRKSYGNVLIATGIMGVGLGFYFWLKGSETPEFVGHFLWDIWSPLNWFKSRFSGFDGASDYTMINLISVFYHFFHPAYFFLGIPLVVMSYRSVQKKKEYQVMLAAIILYSLFVAGLNFQNKRYLILSFPLVLILTDEGYQWFVRKIPANWHIAIYGLLVVIQLGLCTYVFRSFYEYNQIEQRVAIMVKKQPPTTLYTFELNPSLESYGAEHQVINLYHEPITTFSQGELLLVNPSKWEFQWKDRNPMINWVYAQENFEVELLDRDESGWELYVIGERKE